MYRFSEVEAALRRALRSEIVDLLGAAGQKDFTRIDRLGLSALIALAEAMITLLDEHAYTLQLEIVLGGAKEFDAQMKNIKDKKR